MLRGMALEFLGATSFFINNKKKTQKKETATGVAEPPP
jgi:hypothetical protein